MALCGNSERWSAPIELAHGSPAPMQSQTDALMTPRSVIAIDLNKHGHCNPLDLASSAFTRLSQYLSPITALADRSGVFFKITAFMAWWGPALYSPVNSDDPWSIRRSDLPT